MTEAEPQVAQFAKELCAEAAAIGLRGCLKVATENAASIKDIVLYKLAGTHSAVLSVKPSEYVEHTIFCNVQKPSDKPFNNCII